MPIEEIQSSTDVKQLDALAEEVRRVGIAAGVDAVGIASAEPFLGTRATLEERRAAGLSGGMQFTYRNPARSTDPSTTLPGAKSLVVGAKSYHRAPPHSDANAVTAAAGQVARYSWVDHYAPLRAALGEVTALLEGAGWRARVLVDDNALVDREAAYRAGLGWYGKNTNLMLVGRGSWFVLGSVVTDAPLPTSDSPVEDGCGSCVRCLPACPTGALVAPGVLDARRCLAWLLEAPGDFPVEFRAALGGRIYGCDDCQEACPPNRIEIRRNPSPPAERGAEPHVDLVQLLREDDDAELLRRFGRWYIPDRDARHLRRNALVALGNVGDPNDSRVHDVLRAALASDDPMIRRHADWAANQLRLTARDTTDEIDGSAPARHQ